MKRTIEIEELAVASCYYTIMPGDVVTLTYNDAKVVSHVATEPLVIRRGVIFSTKDGIGGLLEKQS